MDANTAFYRHLQYADGDILASSEFGLDAKTLPATPSSILFSPQRSPKGPRPAPSTVYALTEPARIPLPDVPDSVFLSTSPSASIMQNNIDPLQHSEYYDKTSASRNDTEGLTTSLLSAASTSPPPFARATRRTASTSPATSSHPSVGAGSVYQASTQRGPDPWVSQAQESITKGPEEDGAPMPEPQAAQLPSISGYGPVRSPSAMAIMAGSELQTPGTGEERGIQESRVMTEEAGRITFSTLFRRSRNLSSNEDKQHVPASQHPAPPAAAQLISDLANSQATSSLPQTSPSVPITIPATSEPQMRPRSPIVGSLESSNVNIGESVTWEKVDDLNEEWTQLDNPREEVVAMSESSDSELEEDDEEWEACRRQATTGMADSMFVPSVQRRRREAVQHQHVNETASGNATPKGKRTPTTSFAQNGGPQTGGRGYDASSNTTVHMPRRVPQVPQNRLTSQQEELVAEMQRARMARGIGIVPRHAQNTQRIMTVTSDW